MLNPSVFELERALVHFRRQLDSHFQQDTAAAGWHSDTLPSAGHCAAVAVLVNDLFPERFEGVAVSLLSTTDSTHWFNRIRATSGEWEVDADLTADQFDRPPVIVGKPGQLWEAIPRDRGDITAETQARASLLASRAGLQSAKS